MACFLWRMLQRELMMFLYPFLIHSVISIVFLYAISFSLQLLLEDGGGLLGTFSTPLGVCVETQSGLGWKGPLKVTPSNSQPHFQGVMSPARHLPPQTGHLSVSTRIKVSETMYLQVLADV